MRHFDQPFLRFLREGHASSGNYLHQIFRNLPTFDGNFVRDVGDARFANEANFLANPNRSRKNDATARRETKSKSIRRTGSSSKHYRDCTHRAARFINYYCSFCSSRTSSLKLSPSRIYTCAPLDHERTRRSHTHIYTCIHSRADVFTRTDKCSRPVYLNYPSPGLIPFARFPD